MSNETNTGHAKSGETGALIKQIAELQERVKTQTAPPVDENEEMRRTINELKAQLQGFKKNETDNMQKTYENTIVPWFEGCIRDNTEVAEQLVASLQDAIKDARSKDGVWQIAMAASVKHKELIEKVNSLSNASHAKHDDAFDDVNNRKRDSSEQEDVFSSFKRRCL